MNHKKSFFISLLLIVLIVGISAVSATDDTNITLTQETTIEIEDNIVDSNVNTTFHEDNILASDSSNDLLNDDGSDIITVNNWDELQYYCSLTDKDYTLKLKENTNFYPSNYYDKNCQIVINNNVKIIGSNGSYIGDSSQHECYIKDGRYVVEGGNPIKYALIMVPDNNRMGLTLENITFKWDYIEYNPDGVLLQMGGKAKNTIKNCVFDSINTMQGHSCIVYLKKGDAILENCSFINCTTDFGCVSLYDPNSYTTARMTVKDCHFENNFARTEPGCINNCAILTVYNTTFYKNRAGMWAGAIHTHFYASATIYDSNFTDNVAGWNGGALYTYSDLKIYNTVFVGNNCTTNNGGGAIGACRHVSSPHIYVENSLFVNNANNCWSLDDMSTTGTGRGGAISIMDEGSLEVRNTIFISNSASIGTAISATEAGSYGSPDVIIVNNTFINHTRAGDVFRIRVVDTICNISDNYYLGNSIEFSNLTLTKLNEGKEQATLQITASLKNPSYYDSDILNKTLYDVYVNEVYVKTVNSTTFTLDFGDLDICDVYIIPTISNRKSNEVTVTSTREYIFVSKNNGDDNNNGISRDSPVSTIQKALQLAQNYQNIILLDGDFSENLQIDYDVTIKGEGNATLTDYSAFTVNANNFTLKNLNINNLLSDTFIKGNTNLSINNCIFTDNHATLIDNAGFTNIKDSILLNNSKIISSENYNLDYNWWGSTLENPNKPNDLNISNWLVLNATSNVNSLEVNQVAQVQFAFYLNGVKYNNFRLINLDLTPVNGTVKSNITSSDSKVIFTLTECGNGTLTAKYHNIETTVNFMFLKSNPNISIVAEDIMVGDDLTVKVTAPSDAGGNITVKVSNQTQTLPITSAITVFTFTNLKADNYLITTIYSGDDKYLNQNMINDINVNKFDSATDISLSPIEVNQDLIITIRASDGATGNVTLYINSQVETLTLTDSQANYTIKKIARGDYLIRAVYNGDEKYLSSQDSQFIEVDNVNATMEITADNITYGAPAIIKIKLNDDAEGNVSVTIDGVINSSAVNNGISEVYLYNLDAGISKEITVFYTGDDNYFNLTKTATFTISKANLTFNITSTDIMIGQNAVIKITVPKRTAGNFTIGNVTSNIPLSGEVEFILTDLEIGEYDIIAVYNGNNYNTISNYTSFRVLEYPAPQWPNEGSNSENTGQSPYGSDANGEVAWFISIDDNIIGDLVIDSEGNIYIATASLIYSINNAGDLRWNFTSESREGNFSGLCIGRNVVISPKSGDTLYFINQTDGYKYGSSNLYQGSSLFAPIIDSNANIYIASEYQHDSGSYKLVKIPYKSWEFGGEIQYVDLGKAQPVTAPVVSEDMIVVLSEGRLRVIDAKTLKTLFLKSGNYVNVRPVIGDGNIVYAVLSDSIVAYSITGSQLWKTKVTGGVGNQLLLDSEIGLYATNANGNLYRYDLATGKESLISNLKITSGVLIDANHNLFFGCDNLFYEITSEGKVLWKADMNNTMTGKPVMDENGTIYVASIDNKIYALTHGELRNPNLNITLNGEVLSITYDSECVGGISFDLNGKTYTETTVSIAGLPGGTYTINVTCDGDLRFAKASKTFSFFVKSKITNIQTTVQGSTVTFALPSDATGTLNIKVSGKTYTKTLTNGKASITLADGTYSITVTYPGNSKYESITKTVRVTVKKPVVKKASKIVAKKKTFKKSKKVKKYTVTLKSGKNPIKKVKLTIKIKNKTFKATTNTKGKATFKIKKLNKKGRYTATVKFAGNKNYKATTKKVKIIVK